MGDMGYFDEQDRLWFCGRKAHRVLADGGKVFYSVCVEAIFESALERLLAGRVKTPRAALVGLGEAGQQRPFILLEGFNLERSPVYGAFKAWRESHELARQIQVLGYPKPFPVDVRHNVKINRELLAQWAEQTERKK
jgi:acyl-CoA synthetase (AMP-forming)/AMP-acid ligase II